MAKLVRCKTCGAEIAKTARFCPNCGAQQHVGALSACAVIMAGKKVTGSFIITCETPLSDVEKIDFSLVAYDNNSVFTVGKSESVTIYPNK